MPRGYRDRGLARACAALIALLLVAFAATRVEGARAAELPEGFVDTVAMDGLELPTAVRFSPDGRVFVAEKSGLLKVFEGLSDPQPEVFADLRLQVNDYFDRGLLGLALDPGFPAEPYVYVLYTHDAEIGGAAPRWGTAEGGDDCPNPPGGFIDGCVVSGRLSRLTASGSAMVGSERILVEDWCQQFWGHSIGALAFDEAGALYASAGEGASAAMTDYGQAGAPRNPCGDPPGGAGATLAPPTAEGGALRSQDLRTASDPAGLGGSIIRVDPETGEGLPDNPFAAAADENLRRIVAYGLRNPFRFALRPASEELWVGDVGWNGWEEINRFELPAAPGQVPNGGWPCFEGFGQQSAWANLGMNLCTSLYAAPAQVTPPVFSYPIGKPVTAGGDCLLNQGSSISALAFYRQGGFPEDYGGALFFGDYARRCIWVMPPDETGHPDPEQVALFEQGSGSAVDLQTGPGGDLFYVDIAGGSIRRISFFEGNRPPTAFVEANPSDGPLPLIVQLDASGSSDPDGDALQFAWDLDDDGGFDDASGSTPSPVTFEEKGDRRIRVRVSDGELQDIAAVTVHAGNTRPTATILSPDAGPSWDAGQQIAFAGSGADADDPADELTLTWSVVLDHCPAACHEHFVSKYMGPSGVVTGPGHEYPASLVLRLTVRDTGGLEDTDELELHPNTAQIAVGSQPSGLQLGLGGFVGQAPFTRTVISDSAVQAVAPLTQQLEGAPASFLRWNDGSTDHFDPVHSFQATADTSLTAVYQWSPLPGLLSPPAHQPTLCQDTTRPRSRLRAQHVQPRHAGLRLRGRVQDSGECAATSRRQVFIYVALRRKARCRFLRDDGELSPLRSCRRRVLLRVPGYTRFGYGIGPGLPPGYYVAGSLAVDRAGNRELPGQQNRVSFRVQE